MNDKPRTTNLGTTWAKRTLPLLIVISMLAGLAISPSPTGDAASAAPSPSDGSVAFLGKPDKGGGKNDPDHTSDGAAAEGLTMDLVRAFEAVPMATQGYTGQGIDVALIDTGVTPVQGLHLPGKVLYGPDLSNEGQFENLANLDTYGHGTHMAGIIAGDDGTEGGFRGMAPDARLVSVKVSGATGETHVAQVVAAIDWVVENRNRDGLNIRVLNLSLGQAGVTSNVGDVLSAAVERAWDAGIVVVVAGGNRGNDMVGLDSPAISPYVLATGSLNGRAVRDGVAHWSNAGDGVRDPDLVAPGRSIVSLRVPGSTLDNQYPEAVVDGRFLRASGTSQAAAVLSGSVALLLSAHPELTADQVKYLLMENANDVTRRSTTLDGAGKVRPDTAAENAAVAVSAPVQNHVRAMYVDPDVQNWTEGVWTDATWSGGEWSAATWSTATWSAATWSAATWSAATWSAATWSATWSNATWSGVDWSGLEDAVSTPSDLASTLWEAY